MIADLDTQEDAEGLLDESPSGPLLLLKHSTRCPVSSSAMTQFQRFHDEYGDRHAGLRFARVLAVERCPVSLWLAEKLGVEHASPQGLLVDGGRVVWHASHGGITVSAMARAVDDIGGNGSALGAGRGT